MDEAPMLEEVHEEPEEGQPFRSVRLRTGRGEVAVRYYGTGEERAGVLWVGGAGGGWDTPAHDLYPRLAEALRAEGLASLRVRFRTTHRLDEAVHDVLAGAAYLDGLGLDRLGLVGHSFGGAVVIQAAARLPAARTVVTLATQGHGADPVDTLGPECSLFAIHGTVDEILAAANSRYVHQRAREPKRLLLYPGAGHVLNEVARELTEEVRAWLTTELSRPA